MFARVRRIGLPAALCLLSPLVRAPAQQGAPPKPVALTADLGYVSAQGNSHLTTFNLAEKLFLRSNGWRHEQQFGAVYGKTDGEESSNLLYVNWRTDYAFARHLSVFVFTEFDRNKFAGISRRFEEAIGLSWNILADGPTIWKIEAGAGLTQQRALDGSNRNFSSLRSKMSLRRNFAEKSYAFQVVEFLPNLEASDDYRMNSETGLVAPLSTFLALKLGYVVRFDNFPEAGKRKSDRIFTTGFQLNF